MRVFIKFAIAFFMCFFLFLICSYLLGTFSEHFTAAVNTTSDPTVVADVNGFVFGICQKTFGVVSVLTLIGTVVAYLLESHRFEGEQFEYYNR